MLHVRDPPLLPIAPAKVTRAHSVDVFGQRALGLMQGVASPPLQVIILKSTSKDGEGTSGQPMGLLCPKLANACPKWSDLDDLGTRKRVQR